MWIILCASTDVSGIWAYENLLARGLAPLELVSAELLANSLRWEHRLSEQGSSVSISLADGRLLQSDKIKGVINRLTGLPPNHLSGVNASDRSYATQELSAFFMSWLYALPRPMLNRPTSQGLSGKWRHISEWVWLASQAGLPGPVYKQSSYEPVDQMGLSGRLLPANVPVKTLFVVDGRVVGEGIPPPIQRGCQRFARLAKTELLGIDFTLDPTGHWSFAGASPLPDLSLGGAALIDCLLSVLRKNNKKEAYDSALWSTV